MLELIKKKLEALPCEAWELVQRETERWEFYYIGHRLDQNRAVRTKETEVTVYVKSEDGQSIGSASDSIGPSASGAEIDAMLGKLIFQAGLVKNPYYSLTDTPVSVPFKTEPVDTAAIAKACILALAEVPESETSRVNSYEIFVSSVKRHTLNSNGVEYVCVYPETEMEVVVNAREGEHEIELLRTYRSGTCDRERLSADIAQLMRYGEDRLHAVPTPKLGKADIVFSTIDACMIYRYFIDRMNAAYIVRKMSGWKTGEPIADGISGDRVTVEVVSSMPNSSRDYPVDSEGNQVFDRYLVKDGVAASYWGSRQFSRYLGVEKSSMAVNARVSGGTCAEEELRQGDCLEIVEFSDFHVDPVSGDIAGEIRLGYLHRGGEVTVVTGGSVSGSMHEAMKSMRFSKDTVQYDWIEIPKVTLLKGLTVTGVSSRT